MKRINKPMQKPARFTAAFVAMMLPLKIKELS